MAKSGEDSITSAVFGTSGGMEQRLIDGLRVPVYLCNADRNIVIYNRAAAELWGNSGVDSQKWPGEVCFLAPDERPLSSTEYPEARVIANHSAIDVPEILVQRADGSRRRVSVHAEPIFDAGGRLAGVVNTLTEMTREQEELSRMRDDAARSAETIRENQRKTRSILDSSVQFMALLDVEGILVEANSTSLLFIGKKREEVVGRPYWTTEWWGDLPELQNAVRDAVRRAAKGATVRMETRHRGTEGRWIDVQFSLKPIHDGNGTIINLLPEARDITDRKRIEMALKEAKESAEAANLAKDRFLAMLSHELRTPLAPVLITVAGMEADPMLPDSVRREIAMVRRNVELESKLIDDLLDVSRIATGKLPLHPEPVDMNEAMRHVCSICRVQVLEKNLRLEVRLDAEAGRALADPARLQQVMWNLLKNAIKFTPEGGAVAVTTYRPENGRVRFQVKDTGIGFEPDAVAHMFDAFEQGGERITRKFGGLGLGLAISKSLIDQHHGTLTAESPGAGKGAVFTVDLPAAPPVLALPPGDATQPAPATSFRLLLIEDHDDTAQALGRFLHLEGYKVTRASDAAQALELLGRESFDLVMSDIGLPDSSGYELMKIIRARWKIKGIAMSGYGMEDDIRRSHESGFSEHLVKPVKLSVLEETIRRLLQPETPGSGSM